MSDNDDAFLSSNVATDEIDEGMFDNEKPTEEVQEMLDKEHQYIQSILPTAQAQIDVLNKEIVEANKLTDFVGSLGQLPTDVPSEQLAAKLESRFAYLNYLITRKVAIIDGMESIEQRVVDVPPVPVPLVRNISIYHTPRVLKKPTGLRGLIYRITGASMHRNR